MKLVQLDEMVELNITPEVAPICLNEDCEHAGKYSECYSHVHVYCQVFDDWFQEKYFKKNNQLGI